MWTCPQCQRNFKRKDQQHSCGLASKDSMFQNRPPMLKDLYEKVVEAVKLLGAFREEALPPNTIYFKTSSTFLGVKVKAKQLEVEFFLDHHEEHPSILKFLQTSKHRFAHTVAVDSEEDITRELRGWIEISYGMMQK